MRRATSMICQSSGRQPLGGSASWSQCWVRRSLLPKKPSRSTHMALGSTTSARAVVSVGYTSETTMKRPSLRAPLR